MRREIVGISGKDSEDILKYLDENKDGKISIMEFERFFYKLDEKSFLYDF